MFAIPAIFLFRERCGMRSAKSRGQLIGLLLFIQIAGLIVPFALLRPMMTADFLADAAAYSTQIKVAVFLLLANCALTIVISTLAYPALRQSGEAAAVLLAAVSVIMFSLQAVDNAHLMSMLSLSREYVQRGGGGGADEIFQTLAAVTRSARRWVHYSELLVIDAWIGLLYSLLYRFRLVPRGLAVFGLVTVLLHFAGITLPLLLGYTSVTLLGVGLALSHIALSGWLLIKGFREKNPT